MTVFTSKLLQSNDIQMLHHIKIIVFKIHVKVLFSRHNFLDLELKCASVFELMSRISNKPRNVTVKS